MNLEKTKSIVLSLLVILSLVLTWGLWTYQPQFDFIQSTNYIKSVSIGEKREYLDIIKPTQFIYHDKDLHYGITERSKKNELYKAVMELNTSEIEEIYSLADDEPYSTLKGKESLEMIFPVELPMGILSYLMGPVNDELEKHYFDRMIVNFGNEPELYFISPKNKQYVKVAIEDRVLEAIQADITNNNRQYPAYFSLHVGKGNIIYLPEEQVALSQITYSSQSISSNELKNALFNDPNKVKLYNTKNGDESYTDGSRALEISQLQNVMRFINPTNQEIYNMDPAEMVINSIDFVNDHSGWTDSYSIMDLKPRQQTVLFQMKIEGYPVFDSIRSATIYQSWRNHEIYEYQRTLTNLRFSIDSEKHQVFIPSGKQLLSGLTETKADFELELLENALIGFDIKRESQNSSVMTAQPKWFIKYNGNWESVHLPTTIIDQGGNSNGLE